MKLENKLAQHVLDVVLVLFVIYPFMVFYWRGLWDLWGIYINPSEYPSVQWGVLGVSAIAFAGYFIGPKLQKFAEGRPKWQYFILTRGFMCVYAALYIGFWRGEWETLDAFLPSDALSCLVNFALAYVPLLLLRCSRSCVLPPMRVALDTRPNVLTPSTRFKTKIYTESYIQDCVFSHFAINGLVIASWRGMMRLNYALIYPDDHWFADHFCLGLGYGLCFLLYAIDKPIAMTAAKCAKVGFWCKVVFEDMCFILVFIAHCILWRGAWNSAIRYTLTDPEKGGWLCFIIGCAGLIVVQNLSYPGAMGCAIDGEAADTDVFLQSKYLRHYLAPSIHDQQKSSNKEELGRELALGTGSTNDKVTMANPL